MDYGNQGHLKWNHGLLKNTFSKGILSPMHRRIFENILLDVGTQKKIENV